MNPLISIVIPVKNAEKWLTGLLKSISEQSLAADAEIILIDSGSTDKSVEMINGYPGVRLIQIDARSFSHGGTRNLGVRAANGKFIVFTVQDAIPADNNWLRELMNGFTNDKVVAVCGKQIVPHDLDKNPVQWYRPLSSPEINLYGFEDPAEFKLLQPEKKQMICAWDNVNAMYRKSVLEQIPFPDVAFAEDASWARAAIEKGHTLAYNGHAVVYHYHDVDKEYMYKRSLVEAFSMYRIFGSIPQVNRTGLLFYLRVIKILLKEKQITIRKKWHWFFYNYHLGRAEKKAATTFLKHFNRGKNALADLEKQINASIPQANTNPQPQ